jgi:hypothetical protein
VDAQLDRTSGGAVGQKKERRRFYRLALAIPVFVRGTDPEGRAFTELAVAINISSGGALVALRRMSPLPGSVTLEMPRPPIPNWDQVATTAVQSMEATIVRSEWRNGSQLLGLQFAAPLSVETAMSDQRNTEI